MLKILLLDGALNTSETSYSTATMNHIESLFANEKYSVKRIDLNQTEFAKTMLTEQNFKTYWNDIESDKWIKELKETDLLVISMSMINFAPTNTVKNFIDAIAVAGKTFTYEGATSAMPIGLLNKLNVLVVASQGAGYGTYTWGDHIKWLKGTFGFLGAKSVNSFDILGTKVTSIASQSPQEYVESVKGQLEDLVTEIKSKL